MGNLYEMGLMLRYMQRIKDGRKCIEMRVNDEKRKLIVPGDQILFHCTEDERETLLVEVVESRLTQALKKSMKPIRKPCLAIWKMSLVITAICMPYTRRKESRRMAFWPLG